MYGTNTDPARGTSIQKNFKKAQSHIQNYPPIFSFCETAYAVLGDVVKYIFKTKIIRYLDVFCFRETVNIFHYFA